jgi:EmrB/QacA subfamily drug resistance transporter
LFGTGERLNSIEEIPAADAAEAALMQPGHDYQPLAETMSRRQVYLILFSLMVTLFIGALDQTVVSVAAPRILADLKGFELLSWMFTSYMLTSTIAIPLVGKLGDLFGRKPFLIVGVVVFSATSALCGAAPNMESFIAFRFAQGLGGGMIFASVFATTGDLFAPAERGKYIGFFTGTFSLASILGPTLGGFITDSLSWRWIFYLNIPIGAVAIPLIYFNLPSRGQTARVKIDFIGAALLSGASVAFLMAMVWGGDKYAWSSPQIVAMLVLATMLTGLFIAQERRHPEPILPLHLFRNQVFLLSNLVVFTFGLGVFGAFQYLGLFVQTALGASATASGVISTPQSAGVLITSIVGGQIIARTGKYKMQTVVGTVLIAGAMALLRMVDADSSKLTIAVYMVFLGLGFGLVLPTMSLIVQNAVSPQYIGVASSSSQFFRQIGSVMGIAIFGVILAHTYRGELADRITPEDRSAIEAVNPAILVDLEDPTLRLNEAEWAAISGQIAAVAGGEGILARASRAQDEAVSVATQNIFTVALVAALLSAAFALAMRELPLRRGAQRVTPAVPVATAGAAGATTDAPGQAPVPEPGPGGGGS